MRLTIAAMGRQKGGPEGAMVTDYLARASRTGRALGLGPASLTEVDDRKGGKSDQADMLRRATSGADVLIALDERGKTLSSPQFTAKLTGWRDMGRSHAAFVIGAADGLDPALVAEADFTLSFGAMVWPHMLARAMLAEQIYRAVNIAAGTPYHRV
ncbi:23S rRNA (pseudouridine(1915)-N(3))-methyltransferase RlmH [Alphaproteobacteria bacterium KMM 3653]|uniref:Ribosomal RNA large subunit methyltransferase H n=1 Tax=Harenicola maris TaxID=2841044 RepID=A0AAP2CQM1_9RHOB|nr:23S rRNA (pseudouridine(1915)-N(3))-methyltransferase RlmH [Harenicola maris]